MNPELLELAELAVEHREHADIDCTRERKLLKEARSVMPVVAVTQEVVDAAPGVDHVVGIFSSPNLSYRCKVEWQKAGYQARSQKSAYGYLVYARKPVTRTVRAIR